MSEDRFTTIGWASPPILFLARAASCAGAAAAFPVAVSAADALLARARGASGTAPTAVDILTLASLSIAGAALATWAWALGCGRDLLGPFPPLPGRRAWFLGPAAAGAAAGFLLARRAAPAGGLAPAAFVAVSFGLVAGAAAAIAGAAAWLGRLGPAGAVDAAAACDPGLALALLGSALRRDPEYARARYERACLLLGPYHRLGRTRDGRRASWRELRAWAMADLDEALRLEPGYVPALVRRARARLEIAGSPIWGPHDPRAAAAEAAAALEDLDRAIRADPTAAEAYHIRGQARGASDDRGLRDLDEAVRLAPGDPDYLESRARAHLERGDPGRAIADLDEAIRLRPAVLAYYDLRSRAHRDRGDYARAEADLVRVRRAIGR